MKLWKLASALAVFAVLFASSFAARAADPENTMIITLKDGDVTIALDPTLAPKHVAQIKKLVREGAYDNVAFHRVIDGFMAQTGDVQYGDMKDGYDAERGRHRRLGTARPAGRIHQEGAFRARRGRHGARPESGLGQLAVLHHVRAGSLARRRLHDRRQGRERHGTCRRHQKRRRSAERRRQRTDRMIKVRIAADK